MLTPTPVQISDGNFLAKNERASMFSEPGTGKTLTAIVAYQEVAYKDHWSRAGLLPLLLVVAPPIALRMWEENLATQLPDAEIQRVKSGNEKINEDADIVIVSYARAVNMKTKLADVGFQCAILDESDALKTLSSARTKAFYGTRASMKNCILEGVRYIWPLTGTPIRRYADDLYPQLKALHSDELKRLLGITSLEGYREKFCVTQLRSFHPRQRAQKVVSANKNEQVLASFLYDNGIARRRLLDDIAQYLPPLTVKEVDISYTPSAELDEVSAQAIDEGEASMVMATARRLLGAAKAPAVVSYANDVIAGLTVPVLLLYWHKEAGDIIKAGLEDHGHHVMRIDGSSTAREKEEAEDAFNNAETDFLLGQIQSMGVALNLQKGSHYCIFAERDWSPASQEQAIARLRRMGQEHHVIADICVTDHIIDEAVDVVLSRKNKSTAKIVG